MLNEGEQKKMFYTGTGTFEQLDTGRRGVQRLILERTEILLSVQPTNTLKMKTTSMEILLRYPYPFVKRLVIRLHYIYGRLKLSYTLYAIVFLGNAILQISMFFAKLIYSIFLGITLIQALTCENSIPNGRQKGKCFIFCFNL